MKLRILFLLLLGLAAGNASAAVILVSIDGYGATTRAAFPMPVVESLAERGLSARHMRPVFPSLTFPNHYSIATGLYPSEHGLVFNRFPDAARERWYSMYDRSRVQDGRWYGGEPLWVVAENSGMKSAAFFFVGTEAAIGGVAPSYAYDFDASIPGERRVDQVIDWLALPEDQRPGFITLYFEQVDEASHEYGPGSLETEAAVGKINGWLQRLQDGIEALGMAEEVSLVIVSDHGQAAMDGEIFVLDDVVDLGDADIVEGGSYLNVYDARMRPGQQNAFCAQVNAAWRHGHCYTRRSAPADWRISDDPRYPELILVADTGHGIVSTADRAGRRLAGSHGWPPGDPAMQAIFVAAGPRVKAGLVDAINAVDVYAFVLALAGLEAPRPIPAERQTLLPFVLGD